MPCSDRRGGTHAGSIHRTPARRVPGFGRDEHACVGASVCRTVVFNCLLCVCVWSAVQYVNAYVTHARNAQLYYIEAHIACVYATFFRSEDARLYLKGWCLWVLVVGVVGVDGLRCVVLRFPTRVWNGMVLNCEGEARAPGACSIYRFIVDSNGNI